MSQLVRIEGFEAGWVVLGKEEVVEACHCAKALYIEKWSLMRYGTTA